MSESDWMLVGRAQSWVRDRLGLDIIVLRCVLVEPDDTDEGSGDAFLFTENLSDTAPRDGSWLDERATTALMGERERTAIRQWFMETREGGPQALQPWEYAGWYGIAADWIKAKLPTTVRVDQYATWSVSSLHRVETASGRSYFKAAPTIFRHEAAVTQMLAERFPGTVPRPIAIDSERGWFLTADFGDQLVATMDAPHWEGALGALVTLQRSSVASVESLLRSGCIDRRPRVLQSQVEELASEGSEWLPDEMATRLRAAVSRFQDLCEEIASSPIPNTLVHGDFHAENVAVSEGRYLIFDWTDACIAHPFVDVATFLRNAEHASTDQATANAGATTTCMDGKTSPLMMWPATCSNAWRLSRRCTKRSRIGGSWVHWTPANAGSSDQHFRTGSPERWPHVRWQFESVRGRSSQALSLRRARGGLDGPR